MSKYAGPRRGDEVEAWIKRTRDLYNRQGRYGDVIAWNALDDLLDDYRLHADTGQPLDVHVSELQQPLVERMEPVAS